MKKLLLILFCSILLSSIALAQQKNYDWRVGFSGGYSNYYGDLSPHRIQGLSNWEAIHHLFYFNENYFEEPSFKISIERQLSLSVGIMFSYGQYSFGMSDRYIQRDGTLMMDAPNFDRALNFQNRTRDMGIAFVFKMDNDIILPANSFLAPYFTLGGGFLDFEVRGDLLNDAGNPYNYAVGNVVRNRIYETNLTPLRTERVDGYSTGAFYANLGLGLRFRLGPRLELFVQSDFIHAFTDYLDDVSGTYRETYDNAFQAYAARPGTNVVDPVTLQRGNPNSPNDWIIYHGVGLKFNFGHNIRAFRAPRISTHYPDYRETATRTTPRRTPQVEERIVEQDVVEERAEQRAETPQKGNTYTYFTNIQMAPSPGIDSLAYKTQLLNWEQQIQRRENRILEGRLQQRRLEDLQRPIDQRYTQLQEDTVMTRSRRNALLNELQQDRTDIRYSLDSIQRRERELETEIDSLQNLKENYRMQPTPYQVPTDINRLIWREHDQDTVPMTTPAAPRRPAAGDTLRPAAEDAQERPAAAFPRRRGDQRQMSPPADPQPDVRQEQAVDQGRQALEERIRRLEAENIRLQARQETPRNIYVGPAGETGRRNPRVTPPRYQQDPVREGTPAGRVRDRSPRPLPFAGLFRRRQATSPSTPVVEPEVEADTIAGAEVTEPREFEETGLAVSSAMVGVPLTEEVVEEVEEETEEIAAEEVIIEEEEEAVSPVIEDPATTRLLKSKVEVFFNVNQIRPEVEEMKKLAPLVDFVKDNEEYRLSLRGFADNTGNVAYNLKLIESRIEEVKTVLKDLYGLSDEQIESEVGGQIVRGARRSPNENDRKVEVRIESRE